MTNPTNNASGEDNKKHVSTWKSLYIISNDDEILMNILYLTRYEISIEITNHHSHIKVILPSLSKPQSNVE